MLEKEMKKLVKEKEMHLLQESHGMCFKMTFCVYSNKIMEI